jgi:hypothetical protein
MSISTLDKIKSSADKIARKEFFDTIGAALKPKTDKSTGAIFRSEVLDKALHVLTLSATIKFLKEYNPNATEAEGTILFNKYRSVAGKYYSTDSAIYTIESSKLSSSYIISSFNKFISGQALTTNALVLLNSLFATNGFNVISTIKKKVVPSNEFTDTINDFLSQQLDIGHSNMSNIEYLTNIATVSGFMDTSPTELANLYELANSTEIKAKVLNFYKDELLTNDSKLNSIIQEKIFEYIYESQLTLIRNYSKKEGFKGLVSLELTKQGALQKISQKVIQNITKTALVEVGIQNAKINQEIGRTIEAYYRRHLPIIYGSLLRVFKEELEKQDVVTLRGSKNMVEVIGDILEQTILNANSIKPINIRSSVKSTISPIKKGGKPISIRKSITKSKKTSITKLRSTSGAFQSVASLQSLLASRLQEVIRKNMAPPALTYQTGRFAESVKLNSVQFDSRQNAITAFLSYMKYPYATFEIGGKQGSIDKSPYALIDRSVREIAAQLTKSRMRTILV